MESPEITRTIQKRADEREEAHIRSFTKWINSKLWKAQPKAKIADLFQDLRNGHALLTLLEILRHERLPREKGKLRVHHVSNIEIGLKALEKDNIKLIGISGQAIADGVHKSTLGLVWSIILHYQVHGALQEDDVEVEQPKQATANTAVTRKKSKPQTEADVEDRLLRWVQNATEGYDDVIQVKDLSKSWRDGRAFNLLIHVHRNDLIKLEAIEKMSNEGRLDHAFTVAEENLQVQKLLEPSDVDQANPDKKLVMMYVSSLYEALREYEPVKRAKRRKVVEEELVSSASSTVESSIPDMPSEPFLKFKDDLSQTSDNMQTVANHLSEIEDTFQNRIDVQRWQNYEGEFQAVKSQVETLNKSGTKATNDPSVQLLEAEEIRSDLKALDSRWSDLMDRTGKQQKRVAFFREKDGQLMKQWRKQTEIFLDWMDKMDEKFENIEAMKSEEDINELVKQAQALKDLRDAINTNSVAGETFEFGRGLMKGNELSAENQAKIKQQLIELEKELQILKERAGQDIDRYNKSIETLRRTQSDQMGKWRKEAEAMCDWLDRMEDQLDALETQSGGRDVKNIYGNLEECEKLHETIKNDTTPQSIVECGEIMMAEKTLSKEQKLKIEKQLTEMKNEWRSLIAKSADLKTRLTAIRDESELEEKHKVEEWIRRFELLLKQMTKVKGTIAKLPTLPIIGERNRAFQECIKVVDTIKPEYQNAVECAEEVMTHDTCPAAEKVQVKEDVELLHTTWNSVIDVMDGEAKSIHAIMSKASEDQLGKVKEWREKYKEVDLWYETMTPKVEGNFNIGKTLSTVQKQMTEQEEISKEMVMTHEKVEYLLANGQELLQNVNTPEAEKNKLRKDIGNLVERWESLSNTVNNRLQRLADMEKHLEENLQGKLEEFSNQATSIESWLTKEEKKFQAMGGIAPNLEAAMKQKPRVEVLMKEMRQEEKKMAAVLRLGDEILADSSLSEEDNNKLQQDLNQLKNRWEALGEKINWRIQRLDETITKLGSQQQDKLQKWRENAVQISEWLDKTQLRLAERGAIGSDLKTVNAQKDDFQVILDESLEFQRHIYGFTEFGENLRTDPCINEEERSKVQQKTKSLNDRWDGIVQQINNHHNALETKVDELEARHQSERLTEWKTKCEPLQKWLTTKALEAKSLKEIASDIFTVQRQLGETKVLKSRVDNYGKQFRDADDFSKEIQKDPLIEDDKAKQIETQAHDMINRWSALKYGLEGRIDRLSKKEAELQKEDSNKMSEWKTKGSEFKEWLKSKKNELESHGQVGTKPSTVKQQKVELENLVEAVKANKQSLDETMGLADEVLSMKLLSDEDRRQTQQDKLSIKREWDTLHDNLEWRRKRLVNKETELDGERAAMIKEWKNKAIPLQDWLKKEETKCADYQEIPENYEQLSVEINRLQTLLETIEQKEKQLNIILRLSEEILQSFSLSDEDRTMVEDDTQTLQKRLTNLTEKTQANVKRLNQRRCLLDDERNAKIDEWKKRTMPVEQWLVEENNKFDSHSLSPGAGLDVVRKKRAENEVLFNEMLANESRLNSIIKLHEEMQHNQTLSAEDKRKRQQEMNKIKTNWKTLEEKMETAVKRITNREDDLGKERDRRLKEWQTKYEVIVNWIEARNNKLRDSGDFNQNLDAVREELTIVKGSMDELHVQQKEFRILLRLGEELQTHPSMLDEDRSNIGNEVIFVKTSWKELEEAMNERLKKLNDVERKLLEQRVGDMKEWKDVSSPVKEWISKHEQKIRSLGLMKNDHDAVAKQREDVEALDEALNARRNSLENLDSVYQRLSERDSLSEDDKKKLQQELNSIKNNWRNLEELIRETHTKVSKQEGSYHEERIAKMEEWQTKSAPLEQLFSDQGTKWEVDDVFESNDLEAVRKYKQTTQMDVQTIQKQQVELQNAIRLGDEVQKHAALREEDRTKVRMHMSSLKNQWQNLEERMHKKVKRLSSREMALSEERSVLLSNWKGAVSELQDWLAKQEKKIAAQGDHASDPESIRRQKVMLETHLQELHLKEKQLETIVEMGKNTQKHASMSEDERKTIQQDITLLENSFKAVEQKIEEKLKRVNASEKALQDEKDSKLAEWRNKLAIIEALLAAENDKFQGDEVDGADAGLEIVAKQRREMEDLAKDMELQEKKQLASVVRFGDDLKTHSTLSPEDRHQIQEDIETLRENWENMSEKINWKIKRLTEKEAEYKEQGSLKLQEWNKTLAPLQEWFVKSEQKLDSFEDLESNVNNLKRQNEEYLALQKELELQKKRVTNVAVFGEETGAHPSVSQEQKKNIEQSIVTIKNEWERLNEKVNWRLSSLEEKEKALDKQRQARLKEWNAKLEALQGMLQEQENAFKQREGIATDLETVRFKKSEIEDMLKELELEQKKELNNIIQFSEDVFSDPAMTTEDNRKIKQDIGKLRNNIENLEEKMKWRARRLSDKESELEQFRLGKLAEWKSASNNIQRWLSQQDLKLQSLDDLSNDLDEVREQKAVTEELVKEMDTEKNELKAVAQLGDQLLEHPSLLEEDRKLIEQQLLKIQNNWDELVTKIDKRIGRITARETELDIEAARITVEWRNQVNPLRDWINVVINTVGEDSHGLDMDSLKKTRAEIEAVSLEMQQTEGELSNVVSFAYKVQQNSVISLSQKGKIQEDCTNLKEKWDKLETAIEEKAKSLNQSIRNCEQERDGKLLIWRESCQPLSDWLDQADGVLSSCDVVETDLENTRKQREKIETLLTDAISVQPKFLQLETTVEELKQEPCLSKEERIEVEKEAEELNVRHNLVVETCQTRKIQFGETQKDLEKKYEDAKLEEWKGVSKPIEEWINSREQRLQLLQESPEDLNGLYQQQETTETLASEVSAYQTHIESMSLLNQELSDDPLIHDQVADVASMQMKSIKNKWRNLNEKVQAKSESLLMKLTTLLNERQRRIAKWDDKVVPIEEWLSEKEDMLSKLPQPDSLDHDAASRYKNEIVDLVVDIDTQKETLTEIADVELQVLQHPSVPEEERAKLQKDLKNLQSKADSLSDRAQHQVDRLKEKVKSFQKEQKSKLAEREKELDEINKTLKHAEEVITERTVVGADMATVRNQKKTIQEILEHCITCQDRINEFTRRSDDLRNDPCISGAEKASIAGSTDALNERWDLVLAQLKTRNKALEEQLEILEEKHKKELLSRWEEKYEPFSKWLSNTDNIIKSLKDIGDNALLVQKQQEETQVLISQVTNKEPEFNEVISIAQTVNDDALIEDSEAKTVEKLANSLSSRWVVVNEALVGRSESLRIRGAFLGEQEQHLLHEWRRNIEPFNKWLSKVEDDGAYEVDENVGVNTIKDYRVRCKTLEREIEGRKPVVEEIEKLGRKLLSDSAVRDEEKVHIKEELEILQDRWKKLHLKIQDNNKWADIKLIELAKKEQETLDVWRKNVEPFSAWLDDTNVKLDEIQNSSGETENLKERHLDLQRIKEDMVRHEEALARIVTIVSKLTDDENVSETEKNNIKAEMNRLQEKWNNTQNNANLNYLSITEALMELAQREKATLEAWKKQTDPFKEWIVEAKGRFDNLQHGEGYDVVLEKHEKLETLSQELLDHQVDYGNVSQLKNTILQDDHLSTSFKENIKDEGDALDRKWQELNDNITSHSDRVQKQMVTLDSSQKDQLQKWQEELKSLNNQQLKTENDLKGFESLALDVDGAKKQCADLKAVEQEIEVNRSQVEEVSSFCAEISADPNIANKEKTRIKKEADVTKERQNKQERLSVEYQRRLEGKIRELEDIQTSKLEKWKSSSQPLHEWLDGVDDDAKEFDAIGGNISNVQAQFNELQKLSKEFKETEPALFNVLKSGEDLSTDPQVSEEVRERVTQDVLSLRESHTNVAELLKSQREKMKSQLLKLQQHQEKCLIDWNERKTSVDVRVKTMEKRTAQWKPVGNNMEEIQSEKEYLKGIEKELGSIEWELTAILEHGETLCKDKSIFEEEKVTIRDEMKIMETAFRNSQKSVEDRKQSLNAKLDELREARANEFLDKWEKSSSKTMKWMDTLEETFYFDDDDQQSLNDVRDRLEDVDDLSERVVNYQPEFNSTIKCGEDVIREPSVESEAKEKVEDELLSLKKRWQDINTNLDSLTSKLEDRELSLAKEHDELAKKWHQDLQETKAWCKETRGKLDDIERVRDGEDYDELSERRKELQIMIEMLSQYEIKINELEASSQELAKNSDKKAESEKFLNETQTLQKDFSDLKLAIETAQSNYESMVADVESAHGKKLSDWNKKGKRIERQLTNIETEWQKISFLENSNDDEVIEHRKQLEAVASDINSLQPDYERHCSLGRQLSKDPALNPETRDTVEKKVVSYEQRWKSLQLARKLCLKLPRVAVDEAVMKVEERQVESADMDAFDELFGIDSSEGGNCQEVVDWYVDYDSSLKWCVDADDKVQKLARPGEYIILVERQHGEIEELIQLLTTYEATISKVLDKGQHLLAEAETLRLSKDDRSRLGEDLRKLKTKWDELQENAFDTERSLNEHVNKLREYDDWQEKAGVLSQWLEMTDHKLDCCSSLSEDLEEQEKQRIFLKKFATEKSQNEESITDVFNLGRYIVTNHLVLKNKYTEIENDIEKFKNIWNKMLSKADEFCKLFGIPFSHIDMTSSDPLLQWKRKVEEVEKWIANAREKLHLKNNLDFNALKTLPETANEISRGIEDYCVPQLKEITSRAQDILNEKDSDAVQNAEISETITRLSEQIDDLRRYTESQKVHVRNQTLAFFTEKLNTSELMVDRVLEDLKKLKSVGSEAAAVRDQVDLIKKSEGFLQKHLTEFEESKRQIIEMEDKGYLSTDGFEGTLKIKTVELEPRMTAVEKQFSDTKNRLTKGVISFHGQHKDDVKKWLKYCERKLNEIDRDAVEINAVYDEYSKLQELRREIIKGEQGFLNTLELNERLVAEAMLSEEQGHEYQGEIQAIAKSRNDLQRRIQDTNSKLYTQLVEGLQGILSSSIHAFEEMETTLKELKLSGDFDTATEQMDSAKNITESAVDLEQKAQVTLEIAKKITTFGILILKEEDKSSVEDKIKQLKEYAAKMTAKSRAEFNRLLDDYLVMFRTQVDERKTWIAVSENRMSSSYLEIEDLPGFQKELKEHKEFQEELSHRNMEKMSNAADRVTELETNYKTDVRNLEKRWRVLKQWSDDYSLDLQRVVKEWRLVKQEEETLVKWLDPNEVKLSEINGKINWADEEGMKKQITDLKKLQSELEEYGVVLSNTHIKGMALMKFLNDEAAASRTIDKDLSQLDRRWNNMAKEIIARIELLRNIQYKLADLKDAKSRVNTYIDETNAELDEHETKAQRLRGNMSNDMENGETAKEKKVRMKKERENLQQDVAGLVKSLEDKIADFPKNQALVDRINSVSEDIENVADEDSKTALHDELLNFNARWQVIVTRLEDYSDTDLPDQNSFGCMGFMKKRLSGSAF
ncbi:dystrophin-like isoform X2 [Dendronephthya gigantea]|uniref:dystrophin-like isoform X2 n=1 Tax=Dendronephthya gigantea TaxID=151771 RepID=UPI00106CD0E5|nr:dystrophin-like isoform X2 [Dendronephthya gigantea]